MIVINKIKNELLSIKQGNNNSDSIFNKYWPTHLDPVQKSYSYAAAAYLFTPSIRVSIRDFDQGEGISRKKKQDNTTQTKLTSNICCLESKMDSWWIHSSSRENSDFIWWPLKITIAIVRY